MTQGLRGTPFQRVLKSFPTSVTQVVPAAASVPGRALGAGPAGSVGGFSDPVPPEDRPETPSGGRPARARGASLSFLEPLGTPDTVREEGRCEGGKAPALSPSCVQSLEDSRRIPVGSYEASSSLHLCPVASHLPALLPHTALTAAGHPQSQPRCLCTGSCWDPLKPFLK